MPATNPCLSVSVVIPVFNGALFLPEAVACIRRQTLPPHQIIIVDDGSTDDTARVARRLGSDIDFVVQKNSGPAAARNRGLGLARSDCIAFLDVDDLWPAEKLAGQTAGLAAQPAADIVIGPTQLREEAGAEQTLRKSAPGEPSAPPLFYLIGAALFRRAIFTRIGGFDASRRFSEDLDWFIRAREGGAHILIQREIGLIKRCHNRNMTRGKSIADLGIAAVLQASLARRRKDGGIARPIPG